jgi:TPP-dependent pyruvate/acetoin dehydrogenase alpha subunit
MPYDLWALYGKMLRCRFYEEAVIKLWEEGLISGEMHTGIGEEAIIAGVMDHVQDGDALALDHRGTGPLLIRAIDPVLMMREFLGQGDGLCGGMGGHMHLFSEAHLAASSGIVGAAGPAAVGFALSAQYLRPGKIAVAFFGEGAMNQGMLLESLNLSVVWKLPVLFVCKDDQWSITTRSQSVTGGILTERVAGFGMNAVCVDGKDVEEVWIVARAAIEQARKGQGPSFLHASCVHLEGHFLGDTMLRMVKKPVQGMTGIVVPLLRSAARKGGASWKRRVAGIKNMSSLLLKNYQQKSSRREDPLLFARKKLEPETGRLQELEKTVSEEVQIILDKVLALPLTPREEIS